jgi:uncharacterized protein with von Willebrand factor type A (vWA) domain
LTPLTTASTTASTTVTPWFASPAEAVPTLTRLVRQARHAYWLNPEPRAQWDTGDSVATEYGAVVPTHECRNVAQLAAFIEDLA